MSSYTLNLSTLKPGTLVGYRSQAEEGLHFGRFQKYEQIYGLVTVQTIAPYKAEPVTLTVNEMFVERASTKPTPKTHIKAAIEAAAKKAEEEAAAAIALMKEKKAAKKAPVDTVALLAASDRRKAAAAQAWITIRARRAAQECA